MKSIASSRRVIALLLAVPLAAFAQGTLQRSKGELRPPQTPSVTSGVPSGIDTGTGPASKSVPLGTPTMPANQAEHDEMKRSAAAARAAARRRASAAAPPDAKASAARDSAAGTNGRAPAPAPATTRNAPARRTP